MISNERVTASLIASTFLGFGAFSCVATAQTSAATQSDAESTGSVQEVIVSAQKRSENAQDVPISIVALSKEQVVNAGVTNLQQLHALVSGVDVRWASGGVSPYVRGIGTSAGGVENPVAVYVDGVYIPNQREIAMDLIDVNQVTTLKGPQGTLFGRNATGGVIQISTDGPTPTGALHLDTGWDNYQTSRTSAFVSGPLSDDVSGSLMASYVTQGKGWGRDPINGQDLYKIDYRDNFRGKLNFDFSDTAQLRLAADYQQRKASDGLNYVPYPGTQLFYDPGVFNTDPYSSRGEYPEYMTVKSGGVSATLDLDLDFARLVSITAFRRGQFYFQFDSDSSPQTIQNIHYNDYFHSVSQELQLISPDQGKLHWVLGAFYFYNYEEYNPAVVSVYGPLAPSPTSRQSTLIYSNQDVPSIAGFGQATMEVAPRTNLTLGLRFTHEAHNFEAVQNGILANGVSTPNISAPVDASLKNNDLTWRFALDHKLTADINGYVSYNRGVKSGGFNLGSPTNPAFLPEKLDDYELGLKTELLDHKLRINSGLFYYKYTNMQVTVYTQFSRIQNAAAARVYGFDTDLEAHFTNRFYMTGNLSLLNAKYDSFPQAAFGVPNGNPNGSNATVTGDASGNTLPFASPVQVNVSLNYDLPTQIGPLQLSLTNSYNGKFYQESDNRLYQPAWDYLNASVGWTSTDSKFGVRLWGTNLLNKAVQSVATSQSLGYLVAYGNPPRLYGINLSLRL
jgi:outer membrane receptor protein involved in Fe transport